MPIRSLADRRPLLLAILLLTTTLVAACGTVTGSSRTADSVARDVEAAFETIDTYVLAAELTMDVVAAPDDISPGSGGTAKYNVFFQGPDRMRVVVTENRSHDEDRDEVLLGASDILVVDGLVLQRSTGSTRWRPAGGYASIAFLWQMAGPGQIAEWLGRLGPDAEIAIVERDNERMLHVKGEFSEGGGFGQLYSMERRATVEVWIDPEDHLIQEARSVLTTIQHFTNDDGVPQPYESRMTTHVTFTDYNSEMTIELPEEYRDGATPEPEVGLNRPLRFGPGPDTGDDIVWWDDVVPTPTPRVIVWTFPDNYGDY
jgi:hypothetical protein